MGVPYNYLLDKRSSVGFIMRLSPILKIKKFEDSLFCTISLFGFIWNNKWRKTSSMYKVFLIQKGIKNITIRIPAC
jgi:hypothetical protein